MIGDLRTLPGIIGAVLGSLLVGCPAQDPRAAIPGDILHAEDFREGLDRWSVEQQPGGTVTTDAGRLVIDDRAGCTVWLRPRLKAPLIISYTATLTGVSRVSDLNCFWMVTDSSRPGDLLLPGHSRDGLFATYDTLRTYYVGHGGNSNTSTRFRRYPGDGTRPLLPGHDLTEPEFLLEAGHPYRIELVVAGNRVQYLCDGVVIFDFTDPEPLVEGWFGFRTVWSHLEITDFAVHAAVARSGKSDR